MMHGGGQIRKCLLTISENGLIVGKSRVRFGKAAVIE